MAAFQVLLDPAQGRFAVARRDLDAGDVVFTETGYAVAVQRLPARKGQPAQVICTHCIATRQVEPDFPRCAACGAPYCSADCAAAHTEFHTEFECAAMQFVESTRGAVNKEDASIWATIVLCVFRAFREGLREGPAAADRIQRMLLHDDETERERARSQCDGVQVVVPTVAVHSHDDGSAIGAETPVSGTFGDIASLVTNLSSFNPELLADFSSLYALYSKHVPRCRGAAVNEASTRIDAKPTEAPTSDDGGKPFGEQPVNAFEKKKPQRAGVGALSSVGLLPAVSRHVFVSLCCALQCNGFGVWDAKGRSSATIFFPRSSYFNHSCAPNISRRMSGRTVQFVALRPVRRGEPLCLSYISVAPDTAERRKKLRDCYYFLCGCSRCQAVVVNASDTSRCESCVDKVLLPNPASRRETPSGDDGSSRSASLTWDGVCPCCGVVYAAAIQWAGNTTG